MRAIYILAMFCAFLRAEICGATEAMLSYSSIAGGYAFGTAGWTFQSQTDVSVTSLGCLEIVLTNNPSPLIIGLWADDGTLLASNSVTSTSLLLNQSRYEPITPVTLMAGLTYHLGGYDPLQGLTILHVEAYGERSVERGMAPGIVLGRAVTESSGFGFPNTVQGDYGSAFLVPNFQFTAVPEPSFASLLLVGGVVAVWRRML